jgi:hypothetical protein
MKTEVSLEQLTRFLSEKAIVLPSYATQELLDWINRHLYYKTEAARDEGYEQGKKDAHDKASPFDYWRYAYYRRSP